MSIAKSVLLEFNAPTPTKVNKPKPKPRAVRASVDVVPPSPSSSSSASSNQAVSQSQQKRDAISAQIADLARQQLEQQQQQQKQAANQPANTSSQYNATQQELLSNRSTASSSTVASSASTLPLSSPFNSDLFNRNLLPNKSSLPPSKTKRKNNSLLQKERDRLKKEREKERETGKENESEMLNEFDNDEMPDYDAFISGSSTPSTLSSPHSSFPASSLQSPASSLATPVSAKSASSSYTTNNTSQRTPSFTFARRPRSPTPAELLQQQRAAAQAMAADPAKRRGFDDELEKKIANPQPARDARKKENHPHTSDRKSIARMKDNQSLRDVSSELRTRVKQVEEKARMERYQNLNKDDVLNRIDADEDDQFEAEEAEYLASIQQAQARQQKLNDYRLDIKKKDEVKIDEAFLLQHCQVRALNDIKTVSLNHRKLSSVPIILSECQHLKSIDLNSNLISYLSSLQLEELKELKVQHNYLARIEDLTACVNLQILKLDYNNLQSLPSLLNLHLQTLTASSNQLHSLSSIELSTSLTSLDLSHNLLVNIDFLLPCINLRELILNHNQITSLPDLSHLHALDELQITHNRINNLLSMGSPPHLAILHVSHNNIQKFNIPTLLELTDLYFDHNQVEIIEENLLQIVPALEALDLSGNNIQDLNSVLMYLKKLPSLNDVRFVDNPFHQAIQAHSSTLTPSSYRQFVTHCLGTVASLDGVEIPERQVQADDEAPLTDASDWVELTDRGGNVTPRPGSALNSQRNGKAPLMRPPSRSGPTAAAPAIDTGLNASAAASQATLNILAARMEHLVQMTTQQLNQSGDKVKNLLKSSIAVVEKKGLKSSLSARDLFLAKQEAAANQAKNTSGSLFVTPPQAFFDAPQPQKPSVKFKTSSKSLKSSITDSSSTTALAAPSNTFMTSNSAASTARSTTNLLSHQPIQVHSQPAQSSADQSRPNSSRGRQSITEMDMEQVKDLDNFSAAHSSPSSHSSRPSSTAGVPSLGLSGLADFTSPPRSRPESARPSSSGRITPRARLEQARLFSSAVYDSNSHSISSETGDIALPASLTAKNRAGSAPYRPAHTKHSVQPIAHPLPPLQSSNSAGSTQATPVQTPKLTPTPSGSEAVDSLGSDEVKLHAPKSGKKATAKSNAIKRGDSKERLSSKLNAASKPAAIPVSAAASTPTKSVTPSVSTSQSVSTTSARPQSAKMDAGSQTPRIDAQTVASSSSVPKAAAASDSTIEGEDELDDEVDEGIASDEDTPSLFARPWSAYQRANASKNIRPSSAARPSQQQDVEYSAFRVPIPEPNLSSQLQQNLYANAFRLQPTNSPQQQHNPALVLKHDNASSASTHTQSTSNLHSSPSTSSLQTGTPLQTPRSKVIIGHNPFIKRK